MSSSTRLYERLEQIPQNPEDPESLEELVVCAFGAFERYYVCWRNRGGQYRQDGYDLPPSLHEWLFPIDGSTRDFPTLQVVFGRGDDYFASDKDGKLENKEPEIKKPRPRAESVDKLDKPALRRSRTISFIRPTSDPIAKPSSPAVDTPNRETSSRPPSMTVHPQPMSRPKSVSFGRPTSDPMLKPFNITSEMSPKELPMIPQIPIAPRTTRRPLSMSFNSGIIPRIAEEKASIPNKAQNGQARRDCTCGCHSQPPRSKPGYTDASIQTDPEPLRKSLRIDTMSDTSSVFSDSNRSSVCEVDTPLTDIMPPVFMGRMFGYFNRPGYRLGDSLMSTYVQQPIYQDEDLYQKTWPPTVMGRRQTV